MIIWRPSNTINHKVFGFLQSTHVPPMNIHRGFYSQTPSCNTIQHLNKALYSISITSPSTHTKNMIIHLQNTNIHKIIMPQNNFLPKTISLPLPFIIATFHSIFGKLRFPIHIFPFQLKVDNLAFLPIQSLHNHILVTHLHSFMFTSHIILKKNLNSMLLWATMCFD